MLPIPESFRFSYGESELVYGRGCVEQLDELLARTRLNDALVVCGRNVGANEGVMGPVLRGLDERLAGVFDETTPEKTAETVYDGIDAMDRVDPDVLIGLGGGSSLDIARQMSVVASDGRSLSTLREQATTGDIDLGRTDAQPTPVVVIPTTFAGADISSGGSIEVLSAATSPTGQPIRASGSISPEYMLYDPDLFETTPRGALEGSAMNGFNKGVETIYARNGTPITAATAGQGLALLREALPDLGEGDPAAMEQAVIGIILVQFERKGSIIHAFGHGFSRRYPVQQGVIHAVLAPRVLKYLFENVDGNRQFLATMLGGKIGSRTDTEVATAVVENVRAVRNSFDLPTRLRDVDHVRNADFPAIADFILDDYLMAQAPEQLNPTAAEIESVLEDAW